MKQQRNQLIKILLAASLYGVGALYKGNDMITLGIFLTAFLIVGLEVVLSAVRNILNGQVFDENFLMSIATIGAFFVGEYPEGVAVMLFFQVGELFQSYAVNKSRKSIADLMDIRPDYANILVDGEIKRVDPYDVNIGDTIVIKPGEKIPLDAIVLQGEAFIDTAALTGESVPKMVRVGDNLLSGCINTNGALTATVLKEFSDSTVNKILDLVENASNKKSKSEAFITKFARIYTPIVVIIALFLATIPPLLIPNALWSDWVYRALIFLVISCPCALVISVPLSFFGGIGGASKLGILVKGSNYLEALAQTETVVFDKTGTLTKGVFTVTEIAPENMGPQELLRLAAMVECYSNHPIATSLRAAYGKEILKDTISDVTEIPGKGITATVAGLSVAAGNNALMSLLNISLKDNIQNTGTVVHIAIDGVYGGYIIISDEIKSDSRAAIAALKAAGVKSCIMLTGDTDAVGQAVGKSLGIDKIYTQLLPADKVEKLEEILNSKKSKGNVCFVGDGINDAPVLARADVGIAMGALGSDAAIEAADIVIMTDEPSKIATAIKVSRKTLTIVKQNIAFALGVKFLVLIIGALGYATMWDAVFADVGVSVIAILNAIRALNTKNL